MIPDWFTWRDLLVVLVIWLSAVAVVAVPLAYAFWRVSQGDRR